MPSEIFRDEFPKYLAIGMSPSEFWEGDADLPVYYRKADEIRQENANTLAWLQGMYVYEAILDCAPVLRMSTKRQKPRAYSEEPYPLKGTQQQDEKRKKKQAEAGRKHMEQFMEMWNARFRTEQKGGTEHGG